MKIYFLTADVPSMPDGLHQPPYLQKVAKAFIEIADSVLEKVASRRVVCHTCSKRYREKEAAILIAGRQSCKELNECLYGSIDFRYGYQTHIISRVDDLRLLICLPGMGLLRMVCK